MLCFSTVSYDPAFESLTSKSAYVTPVREDKLTPDTICPTLTLLKYTETPITVKKTNNATRAAKNVLNSIYNTIIRL